MKCSKCGFEFEGNFCAQCGTPAICEKTPTEIHKKEGRYCTNCGEAIKGRICLRCGVKNNTTHKYCYYCGTPMEERAAICVSCHETNRNNIAVRVLAIISLCLTPIWFIIVALGSRSLVYSLMVLLAAALMLFLSLPFGDNLIKTATHKKRWLRIPIYIISFMLAFVLSVSPVFLDVKNDAQQEQESQKTVADYTYDEYVMYSTMTKGYSKALDSLKNPKTADFLGISYDPEAEMVYFCVIAENSFGANTKCYIAYSKLYDKIDEGDDRKYYYESAEIKKTMNDLLVFMEAAKNSDEDDVPKPTTNEKLTEYSYEEKEMYEMFIEGIDWINLLYDDVMIIYCKYDSETQDVYFEFTSKEGPHNTINLHYAWYNDVIGLEVGEQYKEAFENADITHYEFEVNNYKEAKKKDIS